MPRTGMLGGGWSPPSTALPGKYSGYELVCLLGDGTRGSVWMADAPLDRPNLACAIEFYELGCLAADELGGFLSRLRDNRRIESEFLSGLYDILDLRDFAGWPPVATVSLWVKPSLDRVFADLDSSRATLPMRLISSWAGHLFEATEALHGGFRCVHGDINPANILLRLAGNRVYRGFDSLDGATAVLGHLAGARPLGTAAPRWWSRDERWSDPARPLEAAASPAEDLYSLGKILERLVAKAGEPSPELAEIAKGLTDGDVGRRMTAKQKLRGHLFRAASHIVGESAVIVRLADSPKHLTTPAREPAGLNWAEFQGVPGYAVLASLGTGGMGSVFEARDLKLNRLVAIKTINLGFGQAALERFHREAQALARLSHPNIVRLYGTGGDRTCPFLILELVAGSTLSRRVASSDGLLSPDEAAGIVRVVAEAVAYAHERGVLHRDIKPANVIITREGRIALIDFGLAKLLDDTPPITAEGTTMGTIGYMSPEQFMGASEIGPATDIFGLGATLYYALTGRSPRRATTFQDLWEELEHPPISPLEFNPEIPRRLEAIVLKCLAVKPEDRFATAAELAEALRQFLEGPFAYPDAPPLDQGLSALASTPNRTPWLQRLNVPPSDDKKPLRSPRDGLDDSDGSGSAEDDKIFLRRAGFVFGRLPECDFVIPSKLASRRHARIDQRIGQFFVEDIDSRNGTFVNDKRIHQPTRLRNDDRIRICDFVFRFIDPRAGTKIRFSNEIVTFFGRKR